MHICANIDDHKFRRQFNGPQSRRRPLFVRDHTLPGFSLRIGADDTRTFFVRVRRKLYVVSPEHRDFPERSITWPRLRFKA